MPPSPPPKSTIKDDQEMKYTKPRNWSVERMHPHRGVYEQRQRSRSLRAEKSRFGTPMNHYSPQGEQIHASKKDPSGNDLLTKEEIISPENFNPKNRRFQCSGEFRESRTRPKPPLQILSEKNRWKAMKDQAAGSRTRSTVGREPDGSTSHLASSDPPTEGPIQPLSSPCLQSQGCHPSLKLTKYTLPLGRNGPPPTPRRKLTPDTQRPLRSRRKGQRVSSPFTIRKAEIHHLSPTRGFRQYHNPSLAKMEIQYCPFQVQARSPLRTETRGRLRTPPRQFPTRRNDQGRPPRPMPPTIHSQTRDPSTIRDFQKDNSPANTGTSFLDEQRRALFQNHWGLEATDTPIHRNENYGWKSPQSARESPVYADSKEVPDKRQHPMRQNHEYISQDDVSHKNAPTGSLGSLAWYDKSPSGMCPTSLETETSNDCQSQYLIGKYSDGMKNQIPQRQLRATEWWAPKSINNVRGSIIKRDDEYPPFFSADAVSRKKSILGLVFEWFKFSIMKTDIDDIKQDGTNDTDEAPPNWNGNEGELRWSEADRSSTSSHETDDVYLISEPKNKGQEKHNIHLMICFIVLCFLGAGIIVYYRVFAPGIRNKRMSSFDDGSCLSAKLGGNSTSGQHNFTFSQRFQAIGEIIQHSSVNGKAFETPGSPQRRALCWLADHDRLQLDVHEAPALVQRYTIAVIRFALEDSSQEGMLDLRWPTSFDHECLWQPTMCNSRKQVTALLLGDQSLRGKVPHDIGNLEALAFLDLSLNKISGSIPSSVGNLAMLQFLSLSFNNMSSSIPNEVSRLSRLEFLNLRSTKVSGTIPEEIGDLSNLETLLLSGNSLTGTIPSTLGKLHKAQEFALRKNFLIGSVPRDLCLLTENYSQVELRVDAWVGCGCCID